LSVNQWIGCALFALPIVVVMEIVKIFRRRAAHAAEASA